MGNNPSGRFLIRATDNAESSSISAFSFNETIWRSASVDETVSYVNSVFLAAGRFAFQLSQRQQQQQRASSMEAFTPAIRKRIADKRKANKQYKQNDDDDKSTTAPPKQIEPATQKSQLSNQICTKRKRIIDMFIENPQWKSYCFGIQGIKKDVSDEDIIRMDTSSIIEELNKHGIEYQNIPKESLFMWLMLHRYPLTRALRDLSHRFVEVQAGDFLGIVACEQGKNGWWVVHSVDLASVLKDRIRSGDVISSINNIPIARPVSNSLVASLFGSASLYTVVGVFTPSSIEVSTAKKKAKNSSTPSTSSATTTSIIRDSNMITPEQTNTNATTEQIDHTSNMAKDEMEQHASKCIDDEEELLDFFDNEKQNSRASSSAAHKAQSQQTSKSINTQTNDGSRNTTDFDSIRKSFESMAEDDNASFDSAAVRSFTGNETFEESHDYDNRGTNDNLFDDDVMDKSTEAAEEEERTRERRKATERETEEASNDRFDLNSLLDSVSTFMNNLSTGQGWMIGGCCGCIGCGLLALAVMAMGLGLGMAIILSKAMDIYLKD